MITRQSLQVPTAAYLYVLHLDPPALAWEYMRRHPEYRCDWWYRHEGSGAIHRWGVRMLEDPHRDARDAIPGWFPDHESVLHVYPDEDPAPDACAFDFWRLPGEKHLVHDGRRLLLQVRLPLGQMRVVLGRALRPGMPYVLASKCRPCPGCRQGRHARACCCGVKMATSLCAAGWAARCVAGRAVLSQAAVVHARPARAMLVHMRTLQALDGALAGASSRDIAEAMQGSTAVARQWHADCALRSRMRRLVRRGEWLMSGGYRELAQLELAEPGVSVRLGATAPAAVGKAA
ncbi:DUF7011 domain-containing protein [Cupriavidus pauculus]|uniref:DUF2285 domain-containing protein n=1 Tax=Cupriavidus pauculus TaxID=82633 RepID=A0A2N5C6U6_9BURK|nr:DUF2285 domain-containing protein [Cupriavidus pauculus]PLP97928.1 hypothetical protein CYJ10_24320 [Cupriavidus pauculus]